MIRWTSSWVIIVLLLVLNGCAGKSETVMLYPGALPADRTDIAVSQEKLTVIIVPFEDQRPEKGEIGRRTHFGGGYTSYAVWNDMPGYVALQPRNQKDGSVARMSLHGSRTNKVFIFVDRDVQDALDAMLKESLDRLMANAKVEQGLLQVK